MLHWAQRGLQPRRLRFVRTLKPEAKHKTLQTGLQIPSGVVALLLLYSVFIF